MKVILQEQVVNLGEAGQVVEVKPGYARNYLMPRGLAIAATRGNLKNLDQRQEAARLHASQVHAQAVKQAEKLAGLELTMPVRAGSEGRLFGSVTSADVAAAIRQISGVDVDRKRIRLDEPIKSTGDFTLALRLHPEVTAEITIHVVAQE